MYLRNFVELELAVELVEPASRILRFHGISQPYGQGFLVFLVFLVSASIIKKKWSRRVGVATPNV